MATQQITPTPRRMQMPDELRTIAEHVLLEARIAIEKAVARSEAPDAYPLSSRGDEPTLEHTLTDRLNELPASQRKRAQARVMPSVRSDAATRARRYGELARIDLRSATPIAVQAALLSTGITLSPQTLLATAGVGTGERGVLSPPHEPMAAVGPAPAFKKLQVRLKKVKCLDETNEPNDSDEILLGGVRLEPDGGVGRVPPFTVSNDFDAGEQVVYNPPKVLASFDLAVRGTGSRHRQSSGSLPDANNLGPQAQSRATTYAPPGTALPDHQLTEVHPHDHLQLERRNKEDANGRDEAQSGWSSTSLIVTGALLVGGSARVAPATPNSPLIPAINARTSCSLRTQRATPTSTVPRDGRVTGGGGRTTGNRAFLTRLLPVRKRLRVWGRNTDSPDLKLRAIAVCAPMF